MNEKTQQQCSFYESGDFHRRDLCAYLAGGYKVREPSQTAGDSALFSALSLWKFPGYVSHSPSSLFVSRDNTNVRNSPHLSPSTSSMIVEMIFFFMNCYSQQPS